MRLKILVFMLGIGQLAVGPGLLALENIRCPGSAPLFSSYIAPYERSNYFVDEGYHLVYYDDQLPLRLVNESAGEISLAFKLGEVMVSNLGDYYQKPVITASFPDSFSLEAGPFAGFTVTVRFALPSSAGALLEITYQNDTKLDFMLYVIYGNTYQKVTCRQTAGGGSMILSYKEPGKNMYFQQDTLPGFKEERHSILASLNRVYAWGGYPVYRNLTGKEAAEKYEYLNGSLAGDIAELVLSYSLPEKKGVFRLARLTAQEGDEKGLEAGADKLLGLNFSDILTFNRQKLQQIPVLIFKDDQERLLYYGGLYLARQQFYPAAGQFPYPYYVFSREPTWGWGHEGQVFHESLSMQSLALFDPVLAMGSQKNFLAVQGKDGYMPYRVGAYFTRTFPAAGEKTTSAPFFSWTNLVVYKSARASGLVPEKDLHDYLEKSYAGGKSFITYLLATRDKNRNGLLEWGGHTLLECVRDYLNAVFDLLGDAPETLNQLEALDLSCMALKEMRSLQEMAGMLGKKAEALYWQEKADNLAALINRYMWDEETGFYYHVHKDTMKFSTPAGISLKRKEIIGLLPLWAGVADKARAEKLIGHLKNPDEFFRRFGIPTLSAADPYYDPQVLGCCRWNGPVWITWVYPVFMGLIESGHRDIAGQVLERMEEAMIFQLARNHRLWESYSPDFTQLNSPKNYIWDALISRMIYEIRK